MRTLAIALYLAAAAGADTVVLKGGKKVRGRVVQEEPEVVVNPFHSTVKGMALGVERFPRDKVAKIVRDLPLPHHAFHAKLREAATPEACLELARWCATEKLREEQSVALEKALSLDPGNAEARKLLGAKALKGDRARQFLLATKYLAAADEAERGAAVEEMRKDPDYPYDLLYLQRARRSSAQPRKLVKDRAVTMRADKLPPNSVYTLLVPEACDPLVPSPLVVGLHGGGAGGADGKLVVGAGWQAMEFYEGECERRGWICACPTALTAGWSNRQNCELIDAMLEELLALYNVDENRVYLTGHSMGGGGAWAQGARLVETWAAVAPTASFGVQGIADFERTLTGLYVYHSDDDPRCHVDGVRPHMRNLVGSDADFVYTEIPGQGHGMPGEVLLDIFEFFDLRRRAAGPGRFRPTVRPQPSFLRKASRDEKKYLPPLEGGEEVADESLEALLRDLRAGGGVAEQAVPQLVKRNDPRVAARVGKILAHGQTQSDVRRYAARVLGALHAREQLKALARGLTVETEMTALLAMLDAIAEIGDAAAADDVARFLKLRIEYMQTRFQGKSVIEHSDWETILPTLARACSVLAALKDAKAADAVARYALDAVLLSGVEVVYDSENQQPLA
ncbi:MAG: hypothetical protein ACREID_00735, partial [Planctomycetota bacterium]